jgi:hypothetical protein
MTQPRTAERVAALEFMNAEVTREIEWLAKSFGCGSREGTSCCLGDDMVGVA